MVKKFLSLGNHMAKLMSAYLDNEPYCPGHGTNNDQKGARHEVVSMGLRSSSTTSFSHIISVLPMDAGSSHHASSMVKWQQHCSTHAYHCPHYLGLPFFPPHSYTFQPTKPKLKRTSCIWSSLFMRAYRPCYSSIYPKGLI